MALPGAIADAPLLFVVMFAIFGPLIWWKWRVTGAAMDKAMQSPTHGLRTSADTVQVRHETGIGTRDVLVMRPNGLGKSIWFAVLFFGSGAVFYAMVVLQDAPTPKDWWTFAGLCLFTVCGMAGLEFSRTRIVVDHDRLTRHRILYRPEPVRFADIITVEPLAKSFARGLRITTTNGTTLKIPASFSGYKDLMTRLADHDPKLSLISKLVEARNARTARG